VPLWAQTVHPHARGDNSMSCALHSETSGSPPRAWGQWSAFRNGAAKARFTPTRVGTIRSSLRVSPSAAVHPHARGDNDWFECGLKLGVGSPPRAWGQWFQVCPLRLGLRFTPTRVGTMKVAAESSFTRSVHPHARGDNSVVAVMRLGLIGSPPRAWGQ